MTRIATTPDAPAATHSPSLARVLTQLFACYSELTKARLSAMVVLTSGAGFLLGSGEIINWSIMLWTMLGTALAAGSANIFNELSEIDRDRRMLRTRSRPLPSRRISQAHAMLIGVALGSAGLVILDIYANSFAATLALASLVIYVALYTPLKPRSTLNTMVGAVCGGLPPMVGWVAATGSLDAGAWVLGGILYVWQLPHFLALAWMYREDYQRGGFAMLPVVDPRGEITSRTIILTSLLLIPLTFALTMHQATGMFFAFGSLVLGLLMLALAIGFHRARSDAAARRVFLASIVYLPVLLAVMVFDRRPYSELPEVPAADDLAWSAPADAIASHLRGSGVVPAILQPQVETESARAPVLR